MNFLSLLFLIAMISYPVYSQDSPQRQTETEVESQEMMNSTLNPSSLFPCDISQSRTKIIFYGENHSSSEDKKISKALISLGVSGEAFVAIEGWEYEDPDLIEYLKDFYNANSETSQVFGYEDKFVHTLTILPTLHTFIYRGTFKQYGEETRLDYNKMRLLLDFITNPYVREAWEIVRQELSKSEHKDMVDFIDKLILIKDDKDEGFNELIAVQQTSLWQQNHSFIQISKNLSLAFGTLAIDKYQEEKNTPDLTSLNQLVADPSSIEKEIQFVNEIAVGWRDQSISQNLGKIYCQAAQSNTDSLWIIIGTLHINSLTDLLNKASSGQIEIVSFPTAE